MDRWAEDSRLNQEDERPSRQSDFDTSSIVNPVSSYLENQRGFLESLALSTVNIQGQLCRKDTYDNKEFTALLLSILWDPSHVEGQDITAARSNLDAMITLLELFETGRVGDTDHDPLGSGLGDLTGMMDWDELDFLDSEIQPALRSPNMSSRDLHKILVQLRRALHDPEKRPSQASSSPAGLSAVDTSSNQQFTSAGMMFLYGSSKRYGLDVDALQNDVQVRAAAELAGRRFLEEYAQGIEQICDLPGLISFPPSRPASELTEPVRYAPGPIVVVITGSDESAVMILAHESNDVSIKSLKLPGFTRQDARKAYEETRCSLGKLGIRGQDTRGVKIKGDLSGKDQFESVLAFLWTSIAKPVLEFLGYIDNRPGTDADLPRLTWCVPGLLSMLPLHAAGLYDRPQITLSDFAVSSFSPSISALGSMYPKSPIPHSTLLAVVQEHTPGCTPLPGTRKEVEHIKKHAKFPIQVLEVNHEICCSDLVVAAMEEYDWVHLACHARQDPTNPTKSCFMLQDGPLSLRTLMWKQFDHKGLAFLSACQTSMGHVDLAEQSIHLASGIMQAGYPSVISTMWSVDDRDAPVVADGVYKRILKGGTMNYKGSARALHAAVKELRAQVGDKEFARWVPFVHWGA